MARTKKTSTIDFPFYRYLQSFIEQERKRIYASFKPLSRKFLGFNNRKENSVAFLRPPQFEALEMYVFLKEFCNNDKLWKIFDDWYHHANEFEGRRFAGTDKHGQLELFGVTEGEDGDKETDKETFNSVYKQIESLQQQYPNYIFALTMGLGKTVLMATSIFYEFLLANKYPKDERYCHNALVFAPDKTVLESLREIQTFDKSKVVPPEYLSWLESNLKFFFLDDTGDALNAIENSSFNIIISNTQKIILKKEHKEKSPVQLLFSDSSRYYKSLTGKWSEMAEAAGDTEVEDEASLITNQRFTKLTRLPQLGIYVDEAHHIFGKKLSDDLLSTTSATSLRVTINELAENLSRAGTKVVACYNYTGTPYVGTSLLPEVVYSYGLRESIDHEYLKKVDIRGYDNVKDQTLAFCRIAIARFWKTYGNKRYEGMLPKIAFFASTIAELQDEVRPAVETVLSELGISTTKILVNVGDDTITSNDDKREFKALDTPASEKQFILLVNKGKEGWNCRSLFGVALHREPKSKVFVLQATMRCLRKIGDYQETASVFLSSENAIILNDELKENFNVTLEDVTSAGSNRKRTEVRIVPPPVSVRIKRIHKLFQLKEKKLVDKVDFALDTVDTTKYKILESKRDVFDAATKTGLEVDVTEFKDKRVFTPLTVVAEVARYLNVSPVLIRNILNNSEGGMDGLLNWVNNYNELLYDVVVPRLFCEMFDVVEFENAEEIDVKLVKEPEEGFFSISYKEGLLADSAETQFYRYKEKSFNLDKYCFDSLPEYNMFWNLLKDQRIQKVWFTGMLTHGQTEFVVNYIDPVSGGVRSYYPDFLVMKEDGSFLIIEVKGDNMIDDAIVLAKKEYARQLAAASNMEYMIVAGTKADEKLSFA